MGRWGENIAGRRKTSAEALTWDKLGMLSTKKNTRNSKSEKVSDRR